MFDFFGIPSFVVTLAGLLAWQGFQLKVLGNTGTINLNDPAITGLTGTFYSDAVGWIIAILGVGLFGGTRLWARRSRTRAGLETPPLGAVVVRICIVAVAVIVP